MHTALSRSRIGLWAAFSAALAGATARANQDDVSNGMIAIPEVKASVGTSSAERKALGRRFDCDPSWLSGDLGKKEVLLKAYWIDRHPVSNAQYLAFVRAKNVRAPWPGGTFTAERADHPVINVNQWEAKAYAEWVGKRLPTGEEWELAARAEGEAMFPWGDDWPGPARLPDARAPIRFDRPATWPVGSNPRGRSASGMEDLAGQVCEWCTNEVKDRGTILRVLLKGACWLYRDPVNYRVKSGCYVPPLYYSPLIGFRCALDGDKVPPVVPRTMPTPEEVGRASTRAAPRDRANRFVIEPAADVRSAAAEMLCPWHSYFARVGEKSTRGFIISTPTPGAWPITLFACESLIWEGRHLLAGYSEPLQPEVLAATPGQCEYQMSFDSLDVTVKLLAGEDCLDEVISVTNKTDTSGDYVSSSCAAQMSHPAFYDAEGRRTYICTKDGGFIPNCKQVRHGYGCRWITNLDLSAHGGVPGNFSLMATTSRDGRYVFGSATAGVGSRFEARGNAWLTCLHTNAVVRVEPKRTVTFVRRLYCLAGGLDDLKARFDADLLAGVYHANGKTE